MAKYEIERSGGPLYQDARETPGLHVHVDASGGSASGGEFTIGVHMERVGEDGGSREVGTIATSVGDVEVQMAEALALGYGVEAGLIRCHEDEHMFLYTDNEDVLRGLVGRGQPNPDLQPVLRDIVAQLPDATRYSVYLCHRGVNLAHEVARDESR